MLSRVNTSLPGIIESFDNTTQTATVKPAVTMKTIVDGVEGNLEYPIIENAPCCFFSAMTAGFAMTLPIRKGDPCLINFSQRAIDNWHETGGVQPPESGTEGVRSHSITDAIITFAPADIPNVFGAWEENGIQLRNRDKTTTLTIRDAEAVMVSGPTVLTISSDGKADLVATSEVTITTPALTVDADDSTFTGNVWIEGGLDVTFDIDSGTNITAIGNVSDSVRSMAGDRGLYNSHLHVLNQDDNITLLPLPTM